MFTWLAGARMSSKSCERCVACTVLPVGNKKTLLDGLLDVWNRSWRVPAIDVAPVSLIAEGMEQLCMPGLIWVLVMVELVCCTLCLDVGRSDWEMCWVAVCLQVLLSLSWWFGGRWKRTFVSVQSSGDQ